MFPSDTLFFFLAFRTQYDFSRSIPREVCWPPELLFDFIEIFRLQEGKIIVDPYSGESALGLIIKTQTGISQSRYFGYEIVDKVAERAIEYSKREFGVESILFGRAFRDAFDIDSVFYCPLRRSDCRRRNQQHGCRGTDGDGP